MAKESLTRTIFILFTALALAIVIYITFMTELSNPPTPKIIINGTEVPVELAKTRAEIALGLSNRLALDKNKGMLFIMGKRYKPTFWMKGMQFPLDIIWIDQGRIVGITENAQVIKNGEIARYNAPQEVSLVLEVNAGFSRQHNFKIGDKVNFLP